MTIPGPTVLALKRFVTALAALHIPRLAPALDTRVARRRHEPTPSNLRMFNRMSMHNVRGIDHRMRGLRV
jgi:hypothetical protein